MQNPVMKCFNELIETQHSGSITTNLTYLFGKVTTMTDATIAKTASINAQAAVVNAPVNNPLASVSQNSLVSLHSR
jgi:hypothetical protein